MKRADPDFTKPIKDETEILGSWWDHAWGGREIISESQWWAVLWHDKNQMFHHAEWTFWLHHH